MINITQHDRNLPAPQGNSTPQQPEEPPVYLILATLVQFADCYSRLQQRYGEHEAARMLYEAQIIANHKGA